MCKFALEKHLKTYLHISNNQCFRVVFANLKSDLKFAKMRFLLDLPKF